ncbi:MAG: ABC transporter permease [Spirochaetales bacterium]|nr:ABC transporter permease [Spirochaetales bacterium]
MKSIFVDMLKNSRPFRFGVSAALFLTIMIILSFFSPYPPNESFLVMDDAPPSFQHLFGTNSRGQDLFWQMTFALRNSFLFGVITAVISRVISLVVGLYSGYKQGVMDRVLMAINDSFVIMPVLPILILLNFLLKEKMNWFIMAAVLSLFGWAFDARLIRSKAMSLRFQLFTDTAVFSGFGTRKIIFREHFPYVLPIVFSTTINNMLWAIGMEVTLAILGLTNVNDPTIGVTIFWANQHQALISGVWWWIAIPVIVTVYVFTGLYMLSISINKYIDPRTRLQRKGRN